MKRETLKEAIEQVLMLDEVASEKTLKRAVEMYCQKFKDTICQHLNVDKNSFKFWEEDAKGEGHSGFGLTEINTSFKLLTDNKRTPIKQKELNKINDEFFKVFQKLNSTFLDDHRFSARGNFYKDRFTLKNGIITVTIGYYYKNAEDNERSDKYVTNWAKLPKDERRKKILTSILNDLKTFDHNTITFHNIGNLRNLCSYDFGFLNIQLKKAALKLIEKIENFKKTHPEIDKIFNDVLELENDIKNFKKEYNIQNEIKKAEKMLKDLEKPQ